MGHMAQVLVTEVARQHSVSRRTVLRMIARGELHVDDKLDWPRTGPYILDADHVAEVFAARTAAKTREAAA
jgi:hypothetical protein